MQEQQWNRELRYWLDQAARAAGFSLVGVAAVRAPDDPAAAKDSARFSAWIDAGYAGEMEYLKRRDQQGTLLRGNVRVAMPWARSVIVCAMNYSYSGPSGSAEDPLPRAILPRSIDPTPPGSGWIARYAWTGSTREDGASKPTDYHDELLARLRDIELGLLSRAGCTSCCYVDTGPLVERTLAAEAGIGWIGKNTCLLNQQLGSWLLLGVIVTSLAVEEIRDCVEGAHSANSSDQSKQLDSKQSVNTQSKNVIDTRRSHFDPPDHCGSCTRCIDACPTGALLGSKSPNSPRTMDASRCIAYLTIEKKGAIDPNLRAPMGRHVFGCDICQDVCPWNRKAVVAQNEGTVSSARHTGQCVWESMRPRPELVNPELDWLAAMDAGQFKRLFKGSPLERTGRKRLLRNVAIAMGNSGEARFLPQLEAWAVGEDPVLADAAQWARARLLAL